MLAPLPYPIGQLLTAQAVLMVQPKAAVISEWQSSDEKINGKAKHKNSDLDHEKLRTRPSKFCQLIGPAKVQKKPDDNDVEEGP